MFYVIIPTGYIRNKTDQLISNIEINFIFWFYFTSLVPSWNQAENLLFNESEFQNKLYHQT